MFSRFTKIFKQSKKICLSKDEKKQTEHVLVALIQKSSDNKFKSFNFRLMNLKPLPIALMAVLLVGVGTSYASEQAVPGDTLYPVKTEFNERVRGFMHFGKKAKVDWEGKKAGRRLGEMKKMFESGELNEEVLAHLDKKFTTHIEQYQKKIDFLREKEGGEKSLEILADLEMILENHSQVLDKIKAGTLEKTDLDSLKEVMSVQKEKAMQMRGKFHEKMKQRFENLTDEQKAKAKEFFKKRPNHKFWKPEISS